jgi:lipoyl synthase
MKPAWLKVQLPNGKNYAFIKGLVSNLRLATVCEEANCPNIGECWKNKTATFMLLGKICTRGCRFCDVRSGKPQGVDPLEPYNILQAIKMMGLSYIVLTMVARDDLVDGGAEHVAKTVKLIKSKIDNLIVETLVSDFGGKISSIQKVIESGVDVFSHNIETVKRLQRKVRDVRASYERSLIVLESAKQLKPSLWTKSSIMVGVGEKEEEVIQTMQDLRKVGTNILTIGQYLQPSKKHLNVVEYIPPEKFEEYKRIGLELGFSYIASGPLVRSSYKALEQFLLAKNKN